MKYRDTTGAFHGNTLARLWFNFLWIVEREAKRRRFFQLCDLAYRLNEANINFVYTVNNKNRHFA